MQATGQRSNDPCVFRQSNRHYRIVPDSLRVFEPPDAKPQRETGNAKEEMSKRVLMLFQPSPIRQYMDTRRVPIRSRVAKDRRLISRVAALLECQFTFAGVNYEATIVDLSLQGAFLSSKFLPPNDSSVTVSLQTPHLKEKLVVEGKVIRGGWGMSELGELSRFGIRFSHSSLDLIELISRLNS